MNRRNFLSAGLGCLTWSAMGLTKTAEAAADERVLVVLFMRGGWDGLNVAVPYGDDDYYRLRPNIAIPRPHDGATHPALELNGFFGFHPSMTGLHALYEQGMVAVLPAVQYSSASRSHFAGQDTIECAVTGSPDQGWLARYLLATGKDPSVSAVSISEQMPRSLIGLPAPPMVIPGLSGLALAASQSDLPMMEDLIETSYGWGARNFSPYDEGLYRIGNNLKTKLHTLRDAGANHVSSSAGYPVSSLGRSMSHAAALVKARLGVELITLNASGWDTHGAQGGAQPQGRMATLLSDFSQSVQAFFNDLGSDASRVVVLTATEFGRTAAENNSEGTDHGHASTWMAISPLARGGMHLGGGWPGLDASSLHEGRYLAHTIDFRSIYAEVLQDFMGFSNTSAILPGFTRKPIGLF
jgi:uncharacterized protein (DUF1501 family)